MNRKDFTIFVREEMNAHGLAHWGVRINSNPDSKFLGLCSYKDECLIFNAEHIDIHPEKDLKNTARHEIAHALTPGHGHDEVWAAKAREIGCDNTLPCSNLSLSPSIIDAIRSGATIEVSFEEHVIRTPTYKVTRLQDKCPTCGKVAKEHATFDVECDDDFSPNANYTLLECSHWIRRTLPKGTPFHLFQAFGDENCKHVWGRNKCELCGRCRPYDFQIEGMRACETALAKHNGFGFFDDMGVGKTWQAGGVVFFHPEMCNPTVWVVKATLVYQFAMFILNTMGDAHLPQIIHGSNTPVMPKHKHYIISYDMLVPKVRNIRNKTTGKVKTVMSGFDVAKFDAVGVKCVVLDECQMIKNAGASRTQQVRRLVKGRKVIALSGTPWKNRGSELFPVLNMLDSTRFWNEEQFKRDYVDYYYSGRYRKEGGIKRSAIARFKSAIADITIRRERKDVLPELPPVTRTKLFVKMDLAQEKEYDDAVSDFVKWYEEQASDISGMHILAAMAKMRHLAAIAKIPATLEYVDEFVENTDRKLVIFLHHVDVGEMIFSDLEAAYGQRYNKDGSVNEDYIPCMQIKGGMNGLKRHELIELFNNSQRALMIASTLSSGEGLNLQTGSDCVLHERQWNPANEEQVEARFIRIGQERDVVNAIYAHLDGLTTIDPQLDGIIERKRRQFHAVHNDGEMLQWNDESILKELAEVIVNAFNAKNGRGRKSA